MKAKISRETVAETKIKAETIAGQQKIDEKQHAEIETEAEAIVGQHKIYYSQLKKQKEKRKPLQDSIK
jgi:hypothetical protein